MTLVMGLRTGSLVIVKAMLLTVISMINHCEFRVLAFKQSNYIPKIKMRIIH